MIKLNKNPAFEASTLTALSAEDSGPHKGIVRVPNSWIDKAKEDTSKFVRRQSVVIHNQSNGRAVVRSVMGIGRRPEGFTEKTVAIDYDTRDTLGIERGQEIDIVVRSARWWEVINATWHHQDMGYRMSMRIALLSFCLGAMSLMISLL